MYSPHQWSEKEREEIATKAYFKWIDAGRPSGQDKHFWNLAEQEALKPVALEEEEIIEVNYPGRRRRRNSSFLDTGYFYCPYIPLQKTPVVLQPSEY